VLQEILCQQTFADKSKFPKIQTLGKKSTTGEKRQSQEWHFSENITQSTTEVGIPERYRPIHH
jgi:hypothetical protein